MMMKVYLYGYIIGFASGALAYYWWMLGEKNKEGDELVVKIGKYDVTVKKDVITNESIVYVDLKEKGYTTFRYSPLQAATMTVDKLEKMVKEHMKGVQNETVEKANS